MIECAWKEGIERERKYIYLFIYIYLLIFIFILIADNSMLILAFVLQECERASEIFESDRF